MLGSRGILHQMGYTENIQDGVSFPESVREPDVVKLKEMAPDLFLARYEIDALIVNQHPYFQLIPPIPPQDTAYSRSMTQQSRVIASPSSVIQGPPVAQSPNKDSRPAEQSVKPQVNRSLIKA